MNIQIAAMKASDWEAVRAIYREGIATRNATFETDAPDWEGWNEKFHRHCRPVAKIDGQVVGWAALSPVSKRAVYAGVADLSIYIAASARGKGVGKALMQALIDESEQTGIWTLQAGIFPENSASIALHKQFGFQEVGIRERIGQMNGVWRDVLLLERRSQVAGI